MNDKWTKVNRVAVIVSFCVCVVSLLIVFVASLMDGYNMYWLFALSGIVSAVISHMIWAMYIEMSENIIHIASRNTRETDRTLSDISQTLGKILANMSNGGAVRPDTPWKCSCGKVNPPDANFCQNCGAVRNDNIPEVKPGVKF